jgi:hypothetical protein
MTQILHIPKIILVVSPTLSPAMSVDHSHNSRSR